MKIILGKKGLSVQCLFIFLFYNENILSLLSPLRRQSDHIGFVSLFFCLFPGVDSLLLLGI